MVCTVQHWTVPAASHSKLNQTTSGLDGHDAQHQHNTPAKWEGQHCTLGWVTGWVTPLGAQPAAATQPPAGPLHLGVATKCKHPPQVPHARGMARGPPGGGQGPNESASPSQHPLTALQQLGEHQGRGCWGCHSPGITPPLGCLCPSSGLAQFEGQPLVLGRMPG
jgi:hypothetical protein